MTSTNPVNENLVQVLQQFSHQYIHHYQQNNNHLPMVEQDEQWPSPCEVKDVHHDALLEGSVFWQPVNINDTPALSFDNVESALALTLHPDIKTYFTTLYSESIDASCKEGRLSLLFAWNKSDFQRLQENIIGHILMKQRLKQQETIFFGVTDEEDMIIAINNDTGAVWVERVGCEPHKKLADSLAAFICELTPIAD